MTCNSDFKDTSYSTLNISEMVQDRNSYNGALYRMVSFPITEVTTFCNVK